MGKELLPKMRQTNAANCLLKMDARKFSQKLKSLSRDDKFTKPSEMYVETENHNKYLKQNNTHSTLLDYR